MALHHDYVALDWVRGEIDTTLAEAQAALEAFVNEPQDLSKLRFCLNHLHQIHGTLQMVEFYGAAVMAEEMEKLTEAIINDTVSSRDEAIEVLMESMLQLPNYLERLKQSRQDLPLILMPSLNDLRAARGEALLTDNALFNPDLTRARQPATGNTAQRMADPRTVPQLRKLRQMYQFALVGVIREKEVKTNLEYMHKSLQYLEGLTRGTPHEQLWRAATGLIEAFENQQLDLSIAIKSLFRNLDLLIKKVIEVPASVTEQGIPEDTLKHLLYYVACSKPVTPRLEALREDYKLDAALPADADIVSEREKLSGPDQGAMSSVTSALAEELNRVKDELDLFMRRHDRQLEDLESQLPPLRQVSNTMTILGMGQPRHLLEELIKRIEEASTSGIVPGDDDLMSMAANLLQAEALMSDGRGSPAHGWDPERYRDTAVPREQLIEAHEAVIHEARNSIEQAKLAIVEFIGSQWDLKHIETVPAQLRSIQGGLGLIPLEKASRLLGLCADFIQNQLIDNAVTPDWTQLDTLADAVTSIEYYLERMADGGDENPALLEVAEDALEHLVSEEKHEKPAVATVQPVMSADKQTDHELIDDEIREIFVEEAGEVISTMLSCYPRWNENPSDGEALAELRRAFHTLKGSGRLVGATEIGELSWSIENLLNKVIEGSLEPGLAIFELTEETIDRIPRLVASFSQGQPIGDTQDLIEKAGQLVEARSSKAVTRDEPVELADTDLSVELPDSEDSEPVEELAEDELEIESISLEPVSEAEPDADVGEEIEAAEAPAPEAPPSPPAMAEVEEEEDDLIDDEILEVFVEEAAEVLENIHRYLPRFLANYDDQESRTEIRRAFHTLKGSGRMVGAKDAGELAWSIENLLNRVLDNTVTMTPQIGSLVQQVVELLPDMVSDFENRRKPRHDTEAIMAHAHAISKGELPPDTAFHGGSDADVSAEVAEVPEATEPLPEAMADSPEDVAEPDDIDDVPMLVDSEPAVASATEGEPDEEITYPEDSETLEIDPALKAIFLTETASHLQCLESFLEEARSNDSQQINDDVSRALHTLKGSANTAGVKPIARIITPTEKFFKEARSARVAVDAEIAGLLADTVGFVRQGLEQIETHPLRPLAGGEEYLERLERIRHEYLDEVEPGESLSTSSAPDPQLLNLFLTEGIDILLDADQILDEWQHNGVSVPEQHQLVTELQTLSQGAQLAGLENVHVLSATMERAYRKIEDENLIPDADFFEVAKEAHEALINMMDEVAAGLATHLRNELIQELQERLTALQAGVTEPVPEDSSEDTLPLMETDESSQAAEEEGLEIDEDLAAIFLEEAADLIDSSAETLKRWSDERDSQTLAQSLQRDLHTLNGGARLAGQHGIASLAHELERLFEKVAEGSLNADDEAINLSMLAHDTLTRLILELRDKGTSEGAPDLLASLRDYIASGPTLEAADTQDEEEASAPPSTDPSGFYEELDEETLELFLEEAEEIMDRTAGTLHQWKGNLGNRALLAEIQRDLHTFKGGARLAQVGIAGDLAHEMETLLEALSEGRLEPRDAHANLLIEAHDRLAVMTEALVNHQALPEEGGLIKRLNAMAQGLDDSAPEAKPVSAPEPADMQEEEDSLPQAAVEDSEEAFGETDIQPEAIQPVEAAPAAVSANPAFSLESLDPELVELFLTEAEELTHETASQLHVWQENPNDAGAMKALLRALHTLKGGARLAEIKPIGDLAHALETLLEGLVEGHIQPSAAAISLTDTANDALVDMIEAATQGQSIASADGLVAQIDALSQGKEPEAVAPYRAVQTEAPVAPTESAPESAEGVSSYVKNSRATLSRMLEMFDQWQLGTQGSLAALRSGASSLAGQSRNARMGAPADLSTALNRALEALGDNAIAGGDTPALIERSLRYAGRLLDQIEEGEQPATPNELIGELSRLAGEEEAGVDLSGIDEDILQVFFEEADELLGGIRRELEDWKRDPAHLEHPVTMQRQLHTLKGGARLATLADIGDLAQELESVAKDASDHSKSLDDALKTEIESLLLQIDRRVNAVRDAYKTAQLREMARSSQGADRTEATEKVVQMQREQAAAPVQRKSKDEERKAPAAKAPATTRQANQDTVRVVAGLLDNLVNLAGETSITRGLMEQQISDFSYTLVEMQATIDRLREQLRRMDMETEAQVLFRMEKEVGSNYEDFDPLEMDRYSSIQQLSRALSESASDLTDLRETMMERIRGTETLLLQQARINTELQEGLMQTRMVPFTSIVPRLRRIVRQVSGELAKQVDFEVFNPEGELDRTVLERMVAPLEHMLRNALDHGIEIPEKRKASGKPETGTVRLSLSREGGDVVIVLEDDGGGINVDAVKRKAVKQGLLEDGQEVPDHEVLQFIFHAGFSTAEKVTQISGRGVGMDVVSSEIKQLGGRVAIDSQLGKGTRFTVHLPFTVSVNRALMVSIGEDYYAIPLNTIEGIVRVSTFELEEYYKPDAPAYEYAGQRYRLQYLGSLLHSDHHPKLQGQPLPLPVILVRGGDRPLALQVDSLLGSREIVVKGLGKQFAGVRGVSGATILGDGSVVVILDLPAMIRTDITLLTTQGAASGEASPAATGPRTVMVVDDSVTVRKVTSRLLERHGMEVLTAKDGVDAIALLQDHKPDVMLLDIEMPRMDGFEVASLVRHDSRLSDIPIIMITSRTGQKHRERAMSIGVNEYMGKPFQENKLLETIERLTGQ